MVGYRAGIIREQDERRVGVVGEAHITPGLENYGLIVNGTSGADTALTYFGYTGARVRLTRSVFNEYFGYLIGLEVRDPDPGRLLGKIAEYPEPLFNRIIHRFGSVHQPVGLGVTSAYLSYKSELEAELIRFSHIARDLVTD